MPWIRNAQIALGIAQTDSWKGVSWIPKPASAPWIRRIEEIARKDVLAEEQPDIVGRGRHRLHPLGRLLVELAMLLLGRGERHRRDQRADGLRMARDRRQAERREDLPEAEIDDEQPPGRCAAHSAISARARCCRP